jgi:hypothetical protein
MSNPIKQLVEKGQLLNYDTCFQHSKVAELAQKNPVHNDDLNFSNSKDRLCRIYYNNAFWRGGINANIDDRAQNQATTLWTDDKTKAAQTKIEITTAEYNTTKNRTRQSIISFHMYGASRDSDDAERGKAQLGASVVTLANETRSVNNVLTQLRAEDSPAVLQEVADKEIAINKMAKQNEEFKKLNDLRKEQVKDLNNRFKPNYHSTIFGFFGYKPMQQQSHGALIFVSFLMGFIGLIILGMKIIPLLGALPLLPLLQQPMQRQQQQQMPRTMNTAGQRPGY